MGDGSTSNSSDKLFTWSIVHLLSLCAPHHMNARDRMNEDHIKEMSVPNLYLHTWKNPLSQLFGFNLHQFLPHKPFHFIVMSICLLIGPLSPHYYISHTSSIIFLACHALSPPSQNGTTLTTKSLFCNCLPNL